MSTSWYFECVTHTPYLRSEDEFTQHTNDYHYHNAINLAQNRPLVFEDNGIDELVVSPENLGKDLYSPEYADANYNSYQYFERNARRFLRMHPDCDLEIISEYGERQVINLRK